MFRYYHAGLGGGWMTLMMLAGLVGLGLLAWLVFRSQPAYRRMSERQFTERPMTEPRRDDALELLRRRLANGEITTEEFDAIRAKLAEDRPRG